jgi:oligopeptide/dipeptide ABC transporter ATP-binding protein
LNLLQNLQNEFGLTYLFISHNLSVVRHISDRIAVMYLGRIVEIADYKEIFEHPLHPYTQGLLASIPIPKPGVKHERIILQGDVPSPVNPSAGCRFRSRCRCAVSRCGEEMPELRQVGKSMVACFIPGGEFRQNNNKIEGEI